jgi:hypothetical protein
MPDYNQKQPGESLTNMSETFRKQMLTKNVYPVSDSDGYSANQTSELVDGTKQDIMGNGESNTGRVNNLKGNLYSTDNEYGSGNIDSGKGYQPSAD